MATKFSPLHRLSFQTRPLAHRDRFLSPGSLWAGTTVTNSAQGVDYPVSTQPLALLPSPLGLPGPLNPTLGKGLGTELPNPPTHSGFSSCLGEEKRQRARCHVGFGSGRSAAAGAQRCPCALPCPCAAGAPPGSGRDARPSLGPNGECHRLLEEPLAPERLPRGS